MSRCTRCGLRHAQAACPGCGAAAPAPGARPQRAVALPGLETLGVLGWGGFAVVLDARDASGERVAVKVASPAPLAAAQLEREGDALLALGGSAVPRLYRRGHLDDGTPFLVLERLHAPSIAGRLAEAAGPVPGAEALGEALLAALAAIHAAGWAHGDVKPENALGGPDGVRLLDLGLAEPLAGAGAPHAGAAAPGTAEYLAPELVAGGRPSAASDVYAAGAVLYELFTGRPPFTGGDAEVRHAHRERRPRPPGEVAPVPPAVSALILACLSKEPAGRPADAGAALALLRAASAASPGAAPAPRAPAPAPAARARRRVAAVLAEGRTDVVALQDAVSRAGGELARSGDGSFAVVVAAPADGNPLRAAVACAEHLLGAGVLRRARIAVLEATPLRREGAPTRWVGAELARPERYPAEGDPEGICALAEVVDALPEAPFAPVEGRPGLHRLRPRGGDGTRGLTATRAGDAPLVGREPLLAGLLALAGRAVEGQPAVAVVLGEAGHGKSRLAGELSDRLAAGGTLEVLGLRARGAAADDGRGALAELVRWALGLPGRGGTLAGGELEALHALLPPPLAEGWPAVALALGLLPPSAPEVRRLAVAPGAIAGYQARAIAEALRRRPRPVAVVLDDAHLAEPALLDALELAALAEARGRFFTCLVGGPELAAARPGVGRRAAAHAELRLEPLDGEAAAELCLALLRPVEHVPARAISALVERSGGVPLLLTELVRALRQQGVVRPGPLGGWMLAADEMERELAVPLADWLAERELSALPEDVAAHAQLLALLGDDARLEEASGVLAEIEREGLGAAFPLDAGAASRRLRELGVVVSRGGALAFRTPLARECVARAAPPARVALVHRAAYRFYARPGAVEEARRRVRLARHAAACGEVEVASAVAIALAEDRAARQEYLAAEALFSRTLELAPEAAVERRLRGLRGRGLARTRLGRQREGAADLDAAAALAAAAGDGPGQADCLLDAAIALDWVNDYDAAARRVEDAVRAAGAGGGPLLRARFSLALGRVAHREGRWEEAVSRLDEAARAAGALGDEGYETLVIALVIQAFTLPTLGRPGEAEEAATRAIELAGGRGDLLHVAASLNSRAEIRIAQRDLAGALADLERYRQLGRELGMASTEHVAAHNAGELLYYADELDRALSLAGKAEELEAHHPEVTSFPFASLLSARIHARRGALGLAREKLAPVERAIARNPRVAGASWGSLAEAVGLAARDGGAAEWDALAPRAARDANGQMRIEILALRAACAARAGRLDEARLALAEARALADRLGSLMEDRLARDAAALG